MQKSTYEIKDKKNANGPIFKDCIDLIESEEFLYGSGKWLLCLTVLLFRCCTSCVLGASG